MFLSHFFPLASQAMGRSETRRQLNALSDHQLRDIGLTRGQIDDVALALNRQPGTPGTRAKRRLAARGMNLLPLFRAYLSG